jgi:hypothetical protein
MYMAPAKLVGYTVNTVGEAVAPRSLEGGVQGLRTALAL